MIAVLRMFPPGTLLPDRVLPFLGETCENVCHPVTGYKLLVMILSSTPAEVRAYCTLHGRARGGCLFTRFLCVVLCK